jgi:hypothetical protein
MNWLDLLPKIFEVCIIPLLGVLTAYLISFINTKKNEIINKSDNDIVDKYVGIAANVITTCVIATNQTYVDALKKEGKFDAEAQRNAFNMTAAAVMAILTDEAKDVLTEAFGDLNTYITQQIEASVNTNK